MTEARIHDDTPCLLGEGPLWHPERSELLWFDILGRHLHGPGLRHRLPDLSSAMGWIDRDTVLMARRGALVRFDLASGAAEEVAALEVDNPVVRPNDGRADPWGGFWIGTMGIGSEDGAGSIWRYHRGEVRRLYRNISIPNAMCFHPSDSYACWADTRAKVVWRQPLGAEGWPSGEPVIHLDLRGTDLNPDGAVMDADGTFWVAFWGAGKVAGYGADGRQVGEFTAPARQTSCPAIGADGTLYCTTAAAALPQETLAREPGQGRTFAWDAGLRFQPEPRVIL